MSFESHNQSRDPRDLLAALGELDDDALSDVADFVATLQRDRAIAAGDIDSIVDAAFAKAFRGKTVIDPWMEDGLLVCPGLLIGVGTLRHTCTFSHVEDDWSWESNDKVADEVRYAQVGAKSAQQSITVLAVADGVELDVVSCTLSGGAHKRDKVRSYRVSRGTLVPTATRSITSDHGRR